MLFETPKDFKCAGLVTVVRGFIKNLRLVQDEIHAWSPRIGLQEKKIENMLTMEGSHIQQQMGEYILKIHQCFIQNLGCSGDNVIPQVFPVHLGK
jgi:hypothetical protein